MKRFTLLALVVSMLALGCSSGSKKLDIKVISDIGESIPKGKTYDFGTIQPYAQMQKVFKVRNDGEDTLEIFKFEIKGDSCFSLQNTFNGAINPGSQDEFQVLYSPDTVGTYESEISIYNNLEDSSPFTFKVKGVCSGVGSPEFILSVGTKSYASGETFIFGDMLAGSPKEITFKIYNNGYSALNIMNSSGDYINICGTDKDSFYVSSPLNLNQIQPSDYAQFKITFLAKVKGLKQADFTIETNDSKVGLYTLHIQGNGTTSKTRDFNNDGYDDIIIIGKSKIGGGKYGVAYVYFGKNNIKSFYSLSQLQADFFIEAIDSYAKITDAYGIGDINNDGYDDIAIVHDSFDVYIYYGRQTSNWKSSYTLKDADITIDINCYGIGSGDINNDGYDDVAIKGITHSYNDVVFIFYGGDSWPSTLVRTDADSEIEINSGLNVDINLRGDVNGDGIEDLVIADYGYPCSTNNVYGAILVYFGKYINFGTQLSEQDANVIIESTLTGEHFAESMSSSGDVNGDGYDDIIVGAPYMGGGRKGGVYGFLGRQNWSSTVFDSNANFTIIQDLNLPTKFGTNIDSSGDMNGDGYDDIVIGIVGDSSSYMSYRETYIFRGRSSWLSNYKASDNTTAVTLCLNYDICSFVYAGDIDNDGYSDLLIGGGGTSKTTEAYLYAGKSNWSTQVDRNNMTPIFLMTSDINGFGFSVGASN